MSTFVVRFVDLRCGQFRGEAIHVGSDERRLFEDRQGLLAFFESINAVRGAVGDAGREEPVSDRTATGRAAGTARPRRAPARSPILEEEKP